NARRRRRRPQPRTAATAELLARLVRCPTRCAKRRERGAALRAEAPLGAVVVVAGGATHRVSSCPQCLPHPARTSERSDVLLKQPTEESINGDVQPETGTHGTLALLRRGYETRKF